MNVKSTQFAAVWLITIIYAIGIDAQLSNSASSENFDARRRSIDEKVEPTFREAKENQLIGEEGSQQSGKTDKKRFSSQNFEGGMSIWVEKPEIHNLVGAKSGNNTNTTKAPSTKAPSTKAPTTAKPVVITTKKVDTTKAPVVTTKVPDVTTRNPAVTTKKPSTPTSNPAPGVTQKPASGGQTTGTPKKVESKNVKESFLMIQFIICGAMFLLSIIAIVTSCMAIRDSNKTKKRISYVQTMATTTMTA